MSRKGVMLFHTLLLRGDMKGESGCMSAFIAEVYAAHVENISCRTSPLQLCVQGTKLPMMYSVWVCATLHYEIMPALFCTQTEMPDAFKPVHTEASQMTRPHRFGL